MLTKKEEIWRYRKKEISQLAPPL